MSIVEVVKYNGGSDIFAWKYPSEELGTWTQLIVNESQEAVLYKGGQSLDVFSSGRHTLDTANIPLLNKIINLPFGGRSPFTAEVWYVNKVYNLDIKWGTPSPIQIQDPKYGIFAPVRSNGVFGIRIEDSKKFLIKLVGTLPIFDKAGLTKYFRGLYVTKVKDAISSYLVHKQISILEINAYIDELSAYMKERIEPVMSEFGIGLASFYVNDISVPEDDPAVKQLKDALSKRAEMNIIGYSYQQERSFDTLEGAAKNSGSTSAPIMGAGLGLGMGLGMGKSVGQGFGGVAQELNISDGVKTITCPKCHAMIPAGQRFCGICGYDIESAGAKRKDASKTVCSACGAALTKKQKFCLECGRKLNLCPQCGNDIPDGANTCTSCGFVLPIPCPHCGKPVAAGAKFCPECGTTLVHKCSNCNAVIEGSPKYCPECGKLLSQEDE
ncbi:MAG: SPFH domain-containing protein [Clostridiaceae bacterium]|nr:SPFH domain-containing protein [Clostridiaceae bacterium]